MGFASGTVTCRRFYVSGAALGEVDDAFIAQLNEYAFGNRGSADPTVQLGWINPTHLYDNRLSGEKIGFGRFAHLALRIDKLGVPGNVAKSLMKMEEEAALAASGREYLSKTERRLAREAGKVRIEQELKSGAYRRIASYPLLLDLEANTLLLGNTSSAVGDRLLELFGNTFSRALIPADADQVAERLLGANTRVLEQLRPFHLVAVPGDFGGEPGLPDANSVQFLGKEFLTWLWFLIDTQQTEGLRLRSGDDVAVMIDRTLRLECDFRLTGTDVITGDAPAGLPEARAALAIGKQPTKAGLLLGSALGEFAFTLDGPRMNVAGLVLPANEEEGDPRGVLEDRFEKTFDCYALLDLLFEAFLRQRTAGAWSETHVAMSAWARGSDAPKRREIAAAS